MTKGEMNVLAYATGLVNYWRMNSSQPRSSQERKLWSAVDAMQDEDTLPKPREDAIAAAARSHS